MTLKWGQENPGEVPETSTTLVKRIFSRVQRPGLVQAGEKRLTSIFCYLKVPCEDERKMMGSRKNLPETQFLWKGLERISQVVGEL